MSDVVLVSQPPTTLATGALDIYGPVPAGWQAIVKEILLCNEDTSSRAVKLTRRTAGSIDYAIRADGSATALNKIKPEDTETWHLDLFLDEGERLRALSDAANKVQAHVSAIELRKVV